LRSFFCKNRRISAMSYEEADDQEYRDLVTERNDLITERNKLQDRSKDLAKWGAKITKALKGELTQTEIEGYADDLETISTENENIRKAIDVISIRMDEIKARLKELGFPRVVPPASHTASVIDPHKLEKNLAQSQHTFPTTDLETVASSQANRRNHQRREFPAAVSKSGSVRNSVSFL
jgi:hypothetical protein